MTRVEKRRYNREWRRTWRVKNLELARKQDRDFAKSGTRRYKKFLSHLKRQYKLTEQQYKALLIVQSNRCAICRGRLIRPVVDHDHNTGRVRGMLCYNCNTGLGHFQDSVLMLEKAISYLSV